VGQKQPVEGSGTVPEIHLFQQMAGVAVPTETEDVVGDWWNGAITRGLFI
jgi:hypothetical protein